MLSPTPSLGAGFSNASALVGARFAFFCAFAVSALFTTALWKRLSPARMHSGAVVAAMIVQIIGGLGYPLTVAGVLPQQFLAIDLVLSALVLPIIDLAWGEAYAQLPMRSIIARTAGSLALAVAVLVLVQVLPDTLSASLMKLLPLGSVLLIIILRSSPSFQPHEPPGCELRTMQPSWKLLAGICCVMAAGAILPGSAETGGFISWWSIIVGNTLAAMLILALLASGRQGDFQKALVMFAGIMTVCYALSGLLIGADSGASSEPYKIAQHCIILATQQCLSIALWFILLDIAQKTHTSPFLACGLGLIATEAGRTAGTGIGMFAPLDPAALSILALLVLVPGMYFFATSERPKEVIVNAEDVLQRRLARIAKTAGLTARECEILKLWVTGHRLDYVAESLFISKNTVKTHLRHIYQKTQTSNKEELLVLFERQT
ncbi:helix-turn-helix transcriptional regulator [Gordonibacter sp. An230]|uniref:helix-turn-helix transcriptional regulator n=1 Tax=Gordonibacter sp. An230 TaxID=1965592 RepID=UPI0013A61975|nr:helix-turn-helix transcriptional regulator [Gordonibacter sp. An230]